MRTFLIIIMFCIAVPAMAQDMAELQKQAQNTNYQIIKLRGQIELNTILLQDAGRRSAKYADQMLILGKDLERINQAVAKLRAVTKPDLPVEDK